MSSAQPGRVCVPKDAFGLPLDRSLIADKNGAGYDKGETAPTGKTHFLTTCSTDCGAVLPIPGGSHGPVTWCGGSSRSCKDKIGVPMDGCSQLGSGHRVCAVYPPRPSWSGVRDCCMNEIGIAGGCPDGLCPGSDQCMRETEYMCTSCRGDRSVSYTCDGSGSGPTWGMMNDALCLALKDQDFPRWKNMMERLCLNEDGSPNAFTRLSGCVDFLNDPDVQKYGTKLNAWCRAQPITPATPGTDSAPANDDLCACFRDRGFYEQYMQALAKKWVIPPGLIDSRPVCIYPNCNNALVVDRSQLLPGNGCKAANIATCLQTVTVNADGKVNGNISISQNCTPGTGLTPKNTGYNTCKTSDDCVLGQVCDVVAGQCCMPNDITVKCTTDDDCKPTGNRVCGTARPDGSRYCQARDGQGGGSDDGGGSGGGGAGNGGDTAMWAVYVLVGVVLVALLAGALWWFVLRGRSRATNNAAQKPTRR